MRFGVLFPGQGSQFVGMGADLFDTRPDLLGPSANEILGFDLRRICLAGPEEDLMLTEHAQPALFAISFALYDEFRRALGLSISGMAGHSLGEYTALVAAGALGYLDGLRLVGLRGRAMAEAVRIEPSGMAALIGASGDVAANVCADRTAMGGRLEVANVNAPGQIVVAGGSEDISWLVDHASDLGIRRAIPLKVAGAFHSSFMKPAAVTLAAALQDVEISEPQVPVWANTTGEVHNVAEISALLARQVVETVRFSDSLVGMGKSGIDAFIHIGPGDVTAGLARKTLPDAGTFVVSSLEDIPSVAEALGTMVRR